MYNIIAKVRAGLLVWLTHQMALPLLRLIRRPKKFTYTRAELHQLPDGLLGKDLVNMLDKNQLQLLPYYVKHDIKHIVLNYDTTAEGEVCLQSFMLGNSHISFPVMATVLFGLFTMPEYWPLFLKAYKRGRTSIQIESWSWFSLLEQPTQSLIQQLNGHEKNV